MNIMLDVEPESIDRCFVKSLVEMVQDKSFSKKEREAMRIVARIYSADDPFKK